MTYRSLDDVYREFLTKVLPRFRHIVTRTIPVFLRGVLVKFRVVLRDGSYIDVYWSPSGKYSYHWERRHVDGTVYKWDNARHHRELRTFPHHVHYGREDDVRESDIPRDPVDALIYVLKFAEKRLSRSRP